MAMLTLEVSDGLQSNPWNGGHAPGGYVPPGASPAPQPVGVSPISVTFPVLYGAPVSSTPFVPGLPKPPVGPQPPGGVNPAPSLPTDCDTCKPSSPAGGTPSGGASPVVAVEGTQPVLKAASACEICDKLKALPWWVWLVVGAVLLYLWSRR